MADDGGKARGAGGGAFYGLGLIGAAIYYFVAADSGWEYVLALPKAIVWPVFFVYDVLSYLHA